MEYTEVVSANPSSSLEVSFRWSTELTHEEFTRSQARATGHRLPRTAHFPSPLLRAALQIQFCVRNAESGDAVALYDLKLSDVRKQVRASLPQARASQRPIIALGVRLPPRPSHSHSPSTTSSTWLCARLPMSTSANWKAR
jgi:hypothetical protein